MIALFRTPTATCRAIGGLLLILLAAHCPVNVIGLAPRALARPAQEVSVTGTCLDEAGQPLAGVIVSLYHEDFKATKHEKCDTCETGDDGQFEFFDAPELAEDCGLGVAFTKTGCGSIIRSLYPHFLKKPLEVQFRPAETLQGRLTDEAGRPVAGVRVWCHQFRTGPLEGVSNAVSDADGKYAITDIGRWTDEDAWPNTGKFFFDVHHPDYAHERPTWERIPTTVDVVLHPGGIIEGKVTDLVTGKPAAGVRVSLQGIKGLPMWDEALTGPDGKYQIRCLKAGQYNLWAETADRACAAIDSLSVGVGKTLDSQDLTLVEGGWIEGRVLDATTGEPITGTPDQPLHVACYGPGRPKSGSACQSATVDEMGQFRLRVAPGLNYPYVMSPDLWSRTEGRDAFQAGMEVNEGMSTKMDFRVVPAPLGPAY